MHNIGCLVASVAHRNMDIESVGTPLTMARVERLSEGVSSLNIASNVSFAGLTRRNSLSPRTVPSARNSVSSISNGKITDS